MPLFETEYKTETVVTRLTPRQKIVLQAMARADGISQCELVRRALGLYREHMTIWLEDEEEDDNARATAADRKAIREGNF